MTQIVWTFRESLGNTPSKFTVSRSQPLLVTNDDGFNCWYVFSQTKPHRISLFSAAEGVEYRLTYINEEGLGNAPQPPGSTWNTPNQFGIFIIQKFFIEFQREVPLNVYYIISGTIYEAPTLSNVFLHRTAEAFLSMEKIFDALDEMARFSLYEGYSWDNLEPPTPSSDVTDVGSQDTCGDGEENLGKFYPPERWL